MRGKMFLLVVGLAMISGLASCGSTENNNNNSGTTSKVTPSSSVLPSSSSEEKKTLDMSGITFADKEYEYDGEEKTLVIEGALPQGVSVTYSNNKLTNPGQTTATAHFNVGDVYKPVNDLTAVLKITKAKVTSFTFSDLLVSYDGQEHSLTIDGTLPEGFTVAYENNTATEPGEYIAKATFSGTSEFYKDIEEQTAKLVIAKDGKYHTVTFTDGETVVTRVVADGETLNSDDIPTPTAKEGYDAAWSIDVTEAVDEDLEATVVYTLKDYSITYHNVGDIENENPSTYNVESEITLEEVEKDGYSFDGWFTDEDFADNIEEIEKGTTGNLDLYAHFVPNQYKIHFDMNGFDSQFKVNIYAKDHTTILKSYTTSKSDPLQIPTNYDSEPRFRGWAKVKEATQQSDFITSDEVFDGNELNLYPQFYVNDYHSFKYWDISRDEYIIFPADSTVTVIIYSSKEYLKENDDDIKITIVAEKDSGSKYNGSKIPTTKRELTLPYDKLYGEGVENSGYFLSKVRFDNLDYDSLTFATTFNNNMDPDIVGDYEVDYDGQVAKLPELNGYGETFIGWKNGDDYYEGGHPYDLTEDLTLTADWKVNVYHVYFYDENGSEEILDPISFSRDNPVTLPTLEKEGYRFTGWSLKGVAPITGITDTSLLSYSTDVVANFYKIDYWIDYLNVSSDYNPRFQYFFVDTPTTELPVPTDAYSGGRGNTFAGWYTTSDFQEDTRITEIKKGTVGGIQLYAKWIDHCYVNYHLNGGINDATNPGEFMSTDPDIPLENPSRSFYDFVGWYTDSSFTHIVDTINTASAGTSVDLYAKWSDFHGKVYSTADLSYIDDTNCDKTFTLMNDISGSVSNNNIFEFTGQFIGNGHSITFGNSTKQRYLFASMGEGATLSGVSFVDGYAVKTMTGGTIDSCTFSGSITYGDSIGSICQRLEGGTISNCTSSMNIKGGKSVGGLVAIAKGGTLENCTFTGTLGYSSTGESFNGDELRTLKVDVDYEYSTVEFVHAAYEKEYISKTTYDTYVVRDTKRYKYIGGLIGVSNGKCTIANCDSSSVVVPESQSNHYEGEQTLWFLVSEKTTTKNHTISMLVAGKLQAKSVTITTVNTRRESGGSSLQKYTSNQVCNVLSSSDVVYELCHLGD